MILNDRLNQNLCKCANTGAGDYTVAEDFPDIVQLARDIEIVSDYDEEYETDDDFYQTEQEQVPPIRYVACDTKLKNLIKKGI